MTHDKSPGGNDAFALFPDLMKDVVKVSTQQSGAPRPSSVQRKQAVSALATSTTVTPPPPPDIRWLSDGGEGEKAQIAKGPTALVLMAGDGRQEISKTFQELGYSIELASSQAEAIRKVTALDFAAVVVDASFIRVPLAESAFHRFMKWLPMPKRRPIHYTFIGPQTHTLYSLEALSESVNMVVNEGDLKHFDVLLRKGLLEHKTLFQPYMARLAQHKKKSAP
ncbi:MAG: hypothetical protein PHI06_01515 [Desulfobulbaceae bacterium]|nr:hypothetical protein [Desulfobulbaceae bacterium]